MKYKAGSGITLTVCCFLREQARRTMISRFVRVLFGRELGWKTGFRALTILLAEWSKRGHMKCHFTSSGITGRKPVIYNE